MGIGELVDGNGQPIRRDRGPLEPSTLMINAKADTEAEALERVRAYEKHGWAEARRSGWL